MRYYSSIAPSKTLQAAINNTVTQIQLNSLTGLPTSYPYTLVIDPDQVSEEIVTVTGLASGTILNVTRAEDGSSAYSHTIGATVKHMVTGRDLQEPQNHIAASTNVHGVTGSVVGTTDTQTLTNKTLTTPTIASFTNATHNHTNAAGGGTLTSAAVTDFTEASQDAAASMITGGTHSGLAVTYDDTGNTLSFNVNDPTITISGDVSGSATMTNLGNTTINVAIPAGTIVNADINASAAIDKTKISGTAITAADTGTVTSAMIANDSIVNADINSSAQIAYGKLNLTNSIVNNDINASAAIALSKLATDPLARANHTGTQTASTISDFNTAVRTNRLDQMAAPTAAVSLNSQKITSLADPTNAQDAVTINYINNQKGANDGLASLDAGGKIPSSQLPDVAITNTSVVASQAAMLALTAQVGDVAVRTDLNKSFILTASPASTLGNWQELLTPTDSVLSVDGQTGAVSLSGTYLAKSGGTMSGAIAMGTNKITGMGDPTSAQDAATKNYVDTAVIAPANLTGPITSVGNVTSVASQTGTGSKFVMDTSPTLVTPDIGVATATSINGTSIPSSKTLVATDSAQYVVPSQTGNGGKFLTTDGTTSSWSNALSVNSSSDAFRITQTGTGNAFVVEDSANPDNTPFVVNASGNVGVGTASNLNQLLTVAGDMELRNNAVTQPTIYFTSQDGTTNVWQIDAQVSNAVNAQLQFINNGNERMRITSGGLVGIGGSPSGVMTFINNNTAAFVGLIVRGAASQTGDLQQWQNSAGTILSSVNSEGQLGLGAAPTAFANLQVWSTGAVNTALEQASSDINGAAIIGRKRRGTFASPTAVLNGDYLISLSGRGYGDTAVGTSNVGLLGFVAAENFTDTAQGTSFVVGTTPTGSVTRTERFRINSAGNVGVGITTPAQLLHLRTDSSATTIRVDAGANNAGLTLARANTSWTSPSVVASGDILGVITFQGYDGSTVRNAAQIQGIVNGTPGAGDMPGALAFFTTPDGSATLTERMRIDNAGNVGIGTASPLYKLHTETDAANIIASIRNSTDSNPAHLYLSKRRGTAASPTVVVSGDNLGQITFYGYDGSALQQAALIQGSVDATPGTNDMPGRLTFWTTPDGSTTPTERMRIDATGRVKLNAGSATLEAPLSLNTQTASYTLALTDAGQHVETNVATANNLTVPPNSSVAFPIGTQILVSQYGAGQTTIVAGAGVTIRSNGAKLKLTGQYAQATLVKRGTDEWYVSGNLSA